MATDDQISCLEKYLNHDQFSNETYFPTKQGDCNHEVCKDNLNDQTEGTLLAENNSTCPRKSHFSETEILECVDTNLMSMEERDTIKSQTRKTAEWLQKQAPSVQLATFQDDKERRSVSLSSSVDAISIIQGPCVDLGDLTLTNALIDSLGKYPDSTIRDINGEIKTYATFKNEAVKIANFLSLKCGLKKGDHVGLLYENSYEGLVVIVACLLTGCIYVPLNPDDPKSRIERIVQNSGIKMVCFSLETTRLASCLLWSCKGVRCIYCIDGNGLLLPGTRECPLMSTDLWDFIAEETMCDTRDGWKSSFTGEPMSMEVLNDYINNTIYKLEDHLDPDSYVLEIGCGSGLTTKALCSRVKGYIATDLSKVMIKRIRAANLQNVQAHCIPAHETGIAFKGYKFNLIILNSVTHCFPSYTYLERVIQICHDMLAFDGKIFVGDVMDLSKRDGFEKALKDFKASNPICRTKTNLSAELYVPQEFFENFGDVFPTICCTPKVGSVDCEVTRYRYDVLMIKESRHVPREETEAARKYTNTMHDIGVDSINHRLPRRDVPPGDDTHLSNVITKEAYLDSREKATRKCTYTMNDLDVDNINHQLPCAGVHPGDDAYILYTSGTTGTPKGVRISQRALLNYSMWAASAYRLDTDSTMPLFSPLTFDFTVTCIIPPMLHGSTIQIFKPFAESFSDIAKSKSLTVAKFSPLQLEMILTCSEEPLSMNTYILGGEEVTYALLEKLKNNKRDIPFKVWNEYGPTEATVGCIVECIDSKDIDSLQDQYIPIGKPINNVTVAAISGSQAVPLGTKGHLAIGGACLTSGFVQGSGDFDSVCWNNEGLRMYRTTDIVSCSMDEQRMYYYGRDDTDVTKIHGIRVDIAEVQTAIRKVPFVDEAWVSTFEVEGSAVLGAAIKTSLNVKYSDNYLKKEITEHIRNNLPVHCVPKVIVQLSNPPANKNGKKNSKLLQTIFINALKSSTSKCDCLPNQSKEGQFQIIWKEALQMTRLPGLNEDFFFDLFGNSILAMYLVTRMRDAGYHVTVRDVFRNPTIRLLCKSCQSTK